MSLKTPADIREYIVERLGTTKESMKFADEFIKYRTSKPNLSKQQPQQMQQPVKEQQQPSQLEKESGKKKKKTKKAPVEWINFKHPAKELAEYPDNE